MTVPGLVHSFWHREPISATTTPLRGNVTADVVVVGGGISGLSCAYYLAKAGADVVLLERGAVGSQASTRNYGELATGWDFGDGPIEKRRQWARFARSATPVLKAVLEEEGIECGMQSSGYWLLARASEHVKFARAEAAKLTELGYEAKFVEPAQVSATTAPTLGALWEQQARLDPYRLVAGLKAAALRRGVRIFENSEVVELIDGTDAEVITKDGKVNARKAVIAMNAFATRFGMTDSFALPVQIFSLATRQLPDAVAEKIGPRRGESLLDLGEPPAERRFFQRFLPEGRLLFGGGLGVVPPAEQMFQPALSEETVDLITTELFRRYPVLTPADIDFWWGGAICRPVGERPIVGALPGAKSVLISLVCNGKGVAVGSSAGRLIAECISPGSTGDADAAAFLEYSAPRKDAFSVLEGVMFKMLRKGPARAALNLLLKKS